MSWPSYRARPWCPLLSEVGFDRLTFDAMAARAGVSKTTLYRRWPTKHELVIDAVRRRVGFSFTVPDQGSFRADVLEVLQLVSTHIRRFRAHPSTIGPIQFHPECDSNRDLMAQTAPNDSFRPPRAE